MKKKINLNLKRFDIPKECGGVNSIAPIQEWGTFLTKEFRKRMPLFSNKADFTVFFPESHLIQVMETLEGEQLFSVGCQGVGFEDVGENFGAFTSQRPATAMKAIGVSSTIIGHYEERKNLKQILQEHGTSENINKLLNKEVTTAIAAGLDVVICIGEDESEQDDWKSVLKKQLEYCLLNVDLSNITIAYEPIWAIGPGKTPPNKMYIESIVSYIKEVIGGEVPVIYGGGLQEKNAEMIASIDILDGVLIALTSFQDNVGFYPEEFEEVVRKYMKEF